MLNEQDKEWMEVLIDTRIDNKVDERLPKEAKWVKWLRRWFMGLTPIAILGAVYAVGIMVNKMDNSLLSPDEKKELLMHMKSAPDPITLDQIGRHATDPGVHMPKTAKDSIYVTRFEYMELIKSNAVDNYNMKKTVDRVYTLQKEQNKSLRAIEYILEKK